MPYFIYIKYFSKTKPVWKKKKTLFCFGHLTDFKLCKPPTWYRCQDNQTCIAHNYKCDGHYDCPHNDDEANCVDYVPHHEEIQCSENEFTCVIDKICIPLEYVCDGKAQCMDNSDESLGCLDVVKRCKGFLCKNKHCLTDKKWLCDGADDCGDNSDEMGCRTLKTFTMRA